MIADFTPRTALRHREVREDKCVELRFGELDGDGRYFRIFSHKWLRVSDTAERSQVDQRVPQQLHPIVPLLEAFKAEQQALELVFPRKRPLAAQA
jgi:hypothetical protein